MTTRATCVAGSSVNRSAIHYDFLALPLHYRFLVSFQSIRTHCRVPNFAMSISSAISEPESSRLVWTVTVIAHLPARIILATEMKRYFRKRRMQKKRKAKHDHFFIVLGYPGAFLHFTRTLHNCP
jgi:hypothetical protein